MQNNPQHRFNSLRLGWHFDFHVPGNVRVGEAAAPEETARLAHEAGAEAVTLFAKCHFGYSYYPTTTGVPHPRMQGDLLGDQVRAVRETDLSLFIYLSFGIDGQGAATRPEWRRVGHDTTFDSRGWFTYICPFTSYVDESLLPQIAEVIERYHPDGLWFDTMSAFNPCSCKTCSREYKERFNTAVPVDENDPHQPEYGKWRHDRGVALLERIAGFIEQRLPDAKICFNQIGSLPFPEPQPRGINLLSLDPSTSGGQSVSFSLHAAFGFSTGTECDVIPTIFNQGWGDWSLASPLRTEQIAAASWARGARVFAGDRLHPQGRLAAPSRQALKLLGRLRREYSADAPSAEARPAPDILLLLGASMTYGAQMEYFARMPKTRLSKIEGAHRLFLDCGANHWVVAEHTLQNWTSDARLIVVPELPSLEPDTAALLERFVADGGDVLFVGSVPLVNNALIDWCGIQMPADTWQDHVYVPDWLHGDVSTPVLIRGTTGRMKLDGARRVVPLIAPYDGNAQTKYGWGIGPPGEEPTEYPALTCHQHGQGRVWTFAPPIFSDYAATGNWQQIAWWRGLLQNMGISLRASLHGSHGNVELVLWENGATTWAILVHHGGEQIVGNWARNIGPQTIGAAVLRLQGDGRTPLRVALGAEVLDWQRSGDNIEISAPLNRIWNVVRVDWSAAS